MSPTSCEFCGGPIRQRFFIVDKGKTWTACFCSNFCSLGWVVVRLVSPNRPAAESERPPLSDRYGEAGAWWAVAGPGIRPTRPAR